MAWDDPLDFKKEGIVLDYKTAGVDIDAGNKFVEKLREKAPGIGGFGGMIKIPSGYNEPILVSGADGVGTKLNICTVANDFTTIGQDLVAMCVNDVITCGAEPLYFLDYIATGKLEPNVLGEVVEGISKACIEAGCSLIGGETAEMPSMYHNDEYDLAGFCTGVVEEEDYISGKTIAQGDIIIGIESNGLHSNGFSLVNQLLRKHQLFYKDVSEIGNPTHIYAKVIRDVINNFEGIKGMAHITGGGLQENLPRIIPRGLSVRINYDAWQMPRVFYKIMMAGEIPPEEMKRVFNLGIGYCIVISPQYEDHVRKIITGCGYNSWTIGDIVL